MAPEGDADHDDDDGEHDRERSRAGAGRCPRARCCPARLAGATRSSPVAESFQIAQATRRLPGEEHGADRRGPPSWEPDRVGDHAGADEHRADDRSVDRAARRPGGTRSGKLGGDELADDRADQAEAEHHRPEPLPDRGEQHQAPRQRGEQDVADVGDLHRDRAAVGTAAQAHGNRQHHGDAEDRRRLGEQLVDVRPRRRSARRWRRTRRRRPSARRMRRGRRGRRRPTSRSSPDDASFGSDEVRATWHGHRTSTMKVPVCPPIATPA